MSAPTDLVKVGTNTPKPVVDTMRKPSMVSPGELVKIMAENTLQDDPRDKRIEHSTKLVKAYLLKNEPEFVRVMEFRDRVGFDLSLTKFTNLIVFQGWTQNKEKGDAFFKEQREKADNTDEAGEQRFFVMMQQIAEEMHRATGALSAHGREIKVLDICMAPGGYTAAVLKLHPNAKAFAITLPKEQGGHPLHISKERLAGLQLLDVTMLAAEYTNQPIPQKHPEREKFLAVRPFKFHSFDLVFCDGMVLRTQKRESHRESTEVTRLACSQLILAMQRIKAGGTLIMLLHKIDSFGAANILYTFSKFANVQVFKPRKKHATRSSFYMIATHVRPDSEPARVAVGEWKEDWWKATFGGEAGTGEPKDDPPESVVLRILEDFGDKLMEMGRPVWRIQADALSKTEYAGDGAAMLSEGSVGSPGPVRPSLWSRLKENAPPRRSEDPASPQPLDKVYEGI